MIPKLGKIMTYGGQRGYLIVAKGGSLTEAQATETIRRAEVHEGLVNALIDIGESLRTKMEIHRPEPLVKPTWFCFLQEERTRLEILITTTLGKSSCTLMEEKRAEQALSETQDA